MNVLRQSASSDAHNQTHYPYAKAGKPGVTKLTHLPSASVQPRPTQLTRNAVIALLHRHEIGLTRQRIEIAYTLFAREQHLSADQILSAVNACHVSTSKATVYNTLNLFVQKNLVRELIIDPSKVFYDRNTAPHHHFYDVETGTLTDIPADAIQVSGLPTLPPGVVTEGIDIIVRTRHST